MEFVTDIVNAITGGIGGLGSGIAGAVVDTWNTVMLTTDGNLSNFAAWNLCFLGIGIIVGAVRKFTSKA